VTPIYKRLGDATGFKNRPAINLKARIRLDRIAAHCS